MVSAPIARAVLSGCLHALGGLCLVVGALLVALAAKESAPEMTLSPEAPILAAAAGFALGGLASLWAGRKVSGM